MTTKSVLDLARAEYSTAIAAFNLARERVTATKREVARLEGKALTSVQLEARRAAGRRQHYLRLYPQLRKIKGAARRKAIDEIISQRDAPRVWRFYLDDMRARKPYRQNRKRYELYKAGLTLAAQFARARGETDNARTLDLHLQGLVDASPRQVDIHYPGEWAVISKALRPEGMNPTSKGARRLLALYQHIIRTHTVEDA